MDARAIIAVDWPNVRQQMQKFFGRDDNVRVFLDYTRLRQGLQTVAGEQLGLSPDAFECHAQFFLQGLTLQDDGSLDPGIAGSRQRLIDRIEAADWQVFVKESYPEPAELKRAQLRLSEAMFLEGREQIRMLRAAQDANGAAADLLGTVAEDILGAYPQELTMTQHWRLRVLTRLRQYSWSQQLLSDAMYPVVARVVDRASWRRHYSLLRILDEMKSSAVGELVGASRWPNLAVCDREELKRFAWSVIRRLEALLRAEAHKKDVDDDINSWVAEKILPLRDRGGLKAPAVVYLVGNDFRSARTIAQRPALQGIPMVLVSFGKPSEQLKNPALLAWASTQDHVELTDYIKLVPKPVAA